MTAILVTGFGRFPGAASNPTTAIATQIARAARRRGLNCVAHVFATTYAAVDRDLPRLIAAHRPDAVLMFGLAARRRHVSLEVFARNRVSVWFPDAAGVVPPRAAIAAGAGASVRGRAPFSRLLAAARATRVKTIFSRDAGGYLCNYVYWRALEAAARPGGPRRVVFVHVPSVAARSRRRPRSKRAGFTMNELVRVGEAILAAVARR
jgi:pyroglutamyl-peptidase